MTAPGPATLSSTPDEARRTLQADVKRLQARVSRLRRQGDGVGPRLKLAEILRELGQRLYLLADWDAARERFEASADLASGLGQPVLEAAALLGLGRTMRQQGRTTEAQHTLERGLKLAQQTNLDDLEADTLSTLASISHALGDTATARKQLHLALDLRRNQGNTTATASIHNNLGVLALHAGDDEVALRHFQEALKLMDEADTDRRTRLRCLNNIALLYTQLGQPVEASTSYRRALELAGEELDDTAYTMLLVNLSDSELQLGHGKNALELAEQALALARPLGAPEVSNGAWQALGKARQWIGDAAGARQAFEAAWDLARLASHAEGQIEALLGLAEVALGEGRPEAALSPLASALDAAQHSERPRLALRAHERLAQANEALGRDAAALTHVKAARELDRRFHDEQRARLIQNLSAQFETEQLRREAETSARVRDAALRAKAEAEAEVHERTRQLQRLALYDALTGLPNRVLFADRLHQAIGQARRQGRSLAVGLLDLDRFKQVNDSLGHAVGDQLLRAVAERLQAHVRSEDTLARMGGDEFLLIFPGADAARTGVLARRLLSAFRTPFQVGPHELFVTPSVGFALYPEHGQEPDLLLGGADRAMYRAKQGGLGSAVYEPERGGFSDSLSIESALNRALEREELLLHYQPQIDLRTGRVIGAEALLRWQRPGLGLVPPLKFIGLAEQTGLIIPIGAWVLREACRQARAWPGLRVAVNLSARQFNQPDLVETVQAALDESGLDPACLEVELTESMLMQSPELAAQSIERLKETGVRVVIDDFGTGYSSLAYLKRFRLDGLKIDRSFVGDLEVGETGQNATILHAIIGLAHNLGFEVVAEGIETERQAAFLRAHGCEVGQGYFFAKPVAAADLPSHARFEVMAGPTRR